jgi:hypothetical protein
MDWWQWLLLITGAWFCLSLPLAGLWSFIGSRYRKRYTLDPGTNIAAAPPPMTGGGGAPPDSMR